MIEVTSKPSELPAILKSTMEAGMATWLVSKPGVGKTEITKQVATQLGRPYKALYTPYLLPTELKGYQYLEERDGKKVMVYAPPSEYPSEENTVFVLEEFAGAQRDTRKLALQFTTTGSIGEWKAPKGTSVILTSNRMEDRADVERLSSAFWNRVVVINVKEDLEDFKTYAYANDIEPAILSFLELRPDLLCDFDGTTWNGKHGFSSPRSFKAASNLLKTKPNASIRRQLLCGSVGPAAGSELHGFMELKEHVPSLKEILKDPLKTKIPVNPDEIYAVAANIAEGIAEKNIEKLMGYIVRLREDCQVFIMRMSGKRNPALIGTPAADKWVNEHVDILV